MSERSDNPIRVRAGELTIEPLFPDPSAPRPPPAPNALHETAHVDEARRRDEEMQRWHAEQEAKAPGRYELIPERDAAARQEQWRRENASGGVAGDMRRSATIGLDSTANALRELVRAVPKVGPSIVAGVDSIDRWMTGRDSETLLHERKERLTAEMTPEMRAAREKKWVDERTNPDGSTSYSIGNAWTDPRSYLSGLTESAAGTAITMVPAAALARGAYMTAIAKGAGERAAAAAASRTALIAGGIGEGMIAGGQTAAEVREAIGKLPDATLNQSEAYRSLLQAGKTPAEARAALTDDMATRGMLIAGVATGIFGGQGDRVLAGIVAEGVRGGLGRRILSGAGRGAVGEGLLEELPQSVAEQMAQNYAVQGADPSRRLMHEVPNAAAGGAVVGGMMGAGMGGAGGAARTRADGADVPAAAPGAAPAPAIPPIGTGIGGPTGPLSAALEYGAQQTGAVPTTAPDGAPPIGADVQVRMPRGQRITGRIEGYGADGEPIVQAEIVDPETGEIRNETLQVPLAQLSPMAAAPVAAPVAPPPQIVDAPAPPAPEAPPPVAAEAPALTPAQERDEIRQTIRRIGETADPPEVGRIPPTSSSELPARADTVPLVERPFLAKPGGRVIVDDPATVGRFGATVQSFEADGSVLVRSDDGREVQVPGAILRVSALSEEAIRAREAKENPPVSRETITSTEPLAREVAGKQIVLPDERHAALYDLGRLRHASKRTLGKGALDLDTDRPMAEQSRLAELFGVTPQRLAQIAEDYRYRVERAAKTAASRTPVKMHGVNDKMLNRMKAEDAREAKKAAPVDETGNPLAKAADPLVTPAAPVDSAANEAATSPTNDLPEPSQAQKEAGNYKLGHLRIGGFDISIENPAGSTRSGTDRGGKPWSITMKSHYGYFRGTKGRDKDHIDVFVKPGTEQLADDALVFVIDQIEPATGKFDEHKVMLGYQTVGQAKRAYLANYAKDWKGLGSATAATVSEFKAWLASGKTSRPFTGHERRGGEQEPAPLEPAIARGDVPVMDDRERQRLENVRKLDEAEAEPAPAAPAKGATKKEAGRPAEKAPPPLPARASGDSDADYLRKLIAYAEEDQGRRGRDAAARAVADGMASERQPEVIIENKRQSASIVTRNTPIGWTAGFRYDDKDKLSGGGFDATSLPTGKRGVFWSRDEARADALRHLLRSKGPIADAASERLKRLTFDVGTNRAGEAIKADGRGVRFVTESGVRIYEKVTIAPDGSIATGSKLDTRFDTAAEMDELDASNEPEETPDPPTANPTPKNDKSTDPSAPVTWGNAAPVDLGTGRSDIGKRARDIVLQRGKADGNEHLIGIGPDGSVRMFGTGGQTNTGWSEEAQALALDAASRIVVHHNHPSSRSLSPPDIGFLALPGIKTVYAHGHDGSTYRASMTPETMVRVAGLTPVEAKRFIERTIATVDRALYDLVNPLIKSEADAKKASAGHHHALMSILQQGGMIEYAATKVPADAAEHAASIPAEINTREADNVRKLLFAGQPDAYARSDRPADAVRHPGDMGIAPEDAAGGARRAGRAAAEAPGRERDSGEAPRVEPVAETPAENDKKVDPAPAPAAPALDFAGNKLFTADKVEAARARLKKKLSQVNSGIDPETLIDGMTIAGAYIEAGVRSFADYASRMVADLGPNVRPYLLSFWEASRHYPGLDARDMTSTEESARLYAELNSAPADAEASRDEETSGGEPEQLDGAGPGALAGTPADPVQRAPEGGNAEQRAARGRRGDVSRGDSARAERDETGRGVPDGAGKPPVPAAGGEQRDAGSAERAPEADRRGDVEPGDAAGTGRGRRDDDGGSRDQREADEGRLDPQPSGGLVAGARPQSYTITDADEIGSGGAKAKFRNNIAAIRLLRKLDDEARTATRSEQSVLAKWVGWGGLRAAFPRDDGSVTKGWDKEAAELKELLTPEEYRAAESSTRNAHYTAPEVVKAMWSAVERLGFKGGQILEPSVGAGNFLGLAPPNVRAGARFTGVELDRITGLIAKNLYLDANIQAPIGYQDVSVPDGHFDLAIGNPPFGSEKLHDRSSRERSRFNIHGYFFAKSVDGLKPGGVLAMVVTSRFLDGADAKARLYIADKADLIGAIRLPNTAFLKNAGTEVTTDIVFIRRREEGEATGDRSWTDVGEFTDKEGRTVPLNRYFLKHPDMMLGEFGAYGTMYAQRDGTESALIAREGDDLPKLLRQAIGNLPANIMKPPGAVVLEKVTVPTNVRDALEGSLFIDGDGNLWIREPDVLGEARARPVELPSDGAKARVAQMVRVRDAFARLRAAQLDPAATDQKIDTLRERLNKVYDAHVAKHGPINADANKRLFRDDPTWPQISALEDNFDKGISPTVAKRTGETAKPPSAKKAAIFSRRTQQPYSAPTSAATAKDALSAVLSDLGRVDLPAMAALYGRTEEEVIAELGPLIYRTPGGAYETAEIYLSGNVKAKLAEAQRAAEVDPYFRRNVEALKEVQPADIEAVDIDAKAGVPWVPAQYVGQFIDHITDVPGASAFYSAASAKWVLKANKATPAAEAQWSTDRATINRVLEAAMNAERIVIYDRLDAETQVLNQQATDAANEKVERVKAEWRRWIWDNDARRDHLARIYNDTFNTDVETRYDGSHLRLPGKVGDDVVELRPHQKNAVWRAIQSGIVLDDHAVGAGKTFAAIASIMELRRTGRATKPMMVVPNHLVGQWAADFVKLYPGARVLAPTERDFEKENRQRLFARISTSDWDAIVIAHSSFKKIGVSAAYEAAFIEEQVRHLEASIQGVRAATGEKSRNVSQLTKQRDNLRTKMTKLIEGGDKDAGLVWEDLGIDALGIDEAHEFKNLAYSSAMQRVAGLGNQTGSQKASDLYIKIKYLLERTGGRNLLFLTGTPLSNSMAEMYTVQRYLGGQRLNQMGLAHFDAWARVFGEVVNDWELSPTGQYKLNQRFARFTNVPELMQLYRSFADVITNDDIKAMLAAEGKRFPLPRVKGGKPTNIVVERSADQGLYIGEGKTGPGGELEFPRGSLIWRAENLPKKPEKGSDNMLKIMSDARKAALDMRLIDARYGDVAGSKVHRAADEMVRIYRQWDAERGTQLVFIDLSTPQNAKAKEAERIRALIAAAEAGDDAAQEKLDAMTPDELSALDGKFSVYDDLKAKLIARGIPAGEIAFIHDANTDLQKQELFGKVRSGRIRFLFGSTPKMGAGTNVQNRLVGLHHLDAPWRPSDLEQRDGRGIRQGNELYEADPDGFEIEILRYATKNTLDARQWQTIEAKARFIEQLRKGNVKSRTVEDIAGEAANAAEMKAAASGNPLILEEMTLRQKMRKLEGAEVEHDREQHRIKGRIRAMVQEREGIERDLPKIEKDAAAAAAMLAADFEATIGGKVMDKPGEMGAAIVGAGRKMVAQGEQSAELGTFGPFKVEIERLHTDSVAVFMRGTDTHSFTIPDIKEADAGGVALRMSNTMRRLVETPPRLKERTKEIVAQVPKLEAQIGPFADADELTQTKARHVEIVAKLRPPPKPAPQKVDPDAKMSEEGDAAPVATITGNELGVEFNSAKDMPALRRAAQRWYDDNLIGSVARMRDGTEVRFNQRGLRESTHGAKGDILLRAVPAIRAIIEQGRIVHQEPGLVPNVRERLVIAAPIDFMGRRLGLALSVHRTPDGQYQYDFSMDRQKVAGPGVGVPGRLSTESRRLADESARDLLTSESFESNAGIPNVGDLASSLNLFVWEEVPKAAGALRDQIAAHPLGALFGRLIEAGKIRFAETAPAGYPTGAQGWTTPDGTITLLAPRLERNGQVLPVLMHEAFHSGVRPLLGDAAWTGLMSRLGRLHRQFQQSGGAARSFFDRAQARVARTGATGDLAVEEFGAYAIEEYEAAPRALRGWVDDVIGRVKAWALVRFGAQLGKVTPAQLRALAAAAIRSQATRPSAAPAFSIESDAAAPADGDARFSLSIQSVRDTVAGWSTDIQPTLLATVPLNYFSELKRPGMTSLDAYLGFKRDMDTYRGNRHEKMVTLAEDWRKFAAANRSGAEGLSSLMHDATLASFDPSVAKPDPAIADQVDIAKRWQALPPAAHDLYRRVRNSYLEQQEELDKIILENVAKAHLFAEAKADQSYRSNLDKVRRDASLTEGERREKIEQLEAKREGERLTSLWGHRARLTRLRQKFESSRLPAPYFPLTRFGRYFVTVKDAEGHVVSFTRFEREGERRRWVRENWSKIQEDMPGVTKAEGVIDNAGDMGRAMDSRVIGEIDALLSNAGVDPSVMDAVWQRYLSTMPDLSIRKRYIHRKGTTGFQADALKGFASHMFHAAHQMARLKYGADLAEALNSAADEAKKADDPTRGGTLVNELRKRHDWVMNPTGSRAVQSVTSAMFVWYLAATPAAAIVNMTQPIMLGVPILGSRLGGMAKAIAALLGAAKDTVAGSGSIQHSTKLTSQEQAAVRAFYESGLIERSQTHDLAGIGDTGVEYSPVRHRIMTKIGWAFHRAEVWNREVTALAAYRMARANHQTHREAIDTAHELTWKVNFDYSNSNRPRILQSDATKLLGVFQNFQINMWYRLFRDLHQSLKGETPQARSEARHQLAGIIGMMGLLGGVTGIAGYNVIMAIAGMFFGKEDDPFEFKHQVERSIIDLFGARLGGMILKGVPGHLSGIDLTSRIGMPDFFLRAPDGTKDGRNWWQQLLFSAMGVVPSTIVSFGEGFKLIGEGKHARGVEAIAPKAIRDLLKAYRYSQEGVVNKRGDEVVTRDRVSAWDLIAQASGFTPAHIAESFERNNRIREAQHQVQTERRNLLNQFAVAYKNGDAETRAAIVDRIKKWNDKPYARGLEITGDTLRQSLRTRQENAARREDGFLIRNASLNRTLRDRLGTRINP